MSWVTNLIVHFSTRDARAGLIAEVNRYFEAPPRPAPLVSLTDPALPKGWYGGSKYLEATLLVGAMNHFDLPGFCAHLRGLAWQDPEAVQLMVKEQEDFAFRLINVFPDSFARAQATLAAEWGDGDIPWEHAAIRLEQETRAPTSTE